MKKHLMYHSEGKFQLIDFQMSHNEMLLRSYANDQRKYNIDILFKGTQSLNIATSFNNIKIFATQKEIGQTANVSLDIEEFIFQLEDDMNNNYFIEAASFGVFENQLGFGISSLGDFMWSDKNKCIFWSHENLEFKEMFGIR